MSTFYSGIFEKVSKTSAQGLSEESQGDSSVLLPVPCPSYRSKSWWKSINARFEGYASLKSQRVFSLLIDGLLFLFLVLAVDFSASIIYPDSLELASTSLWIYLVASFVCLVGLNYAMGVYPGLGLHRTHLAKKRWLLVAMVCMFCSVGYVFGGLHLHGLLLIVTLLMMHNWLWSIAIGKLHDLLVKKQWWGTPVVIIGAGLQAQRMIRWLKQHRQLGLIPYACLDNDTRTHHTKCAGITVAGSLDLAHDLLDKANLAILTEDFEDQTDTQALGAAVVFPQLVRVTPNPNAKKSIDAYRIKITRQVNCGKTIWLKRAMDLTVGFVLLLISIPIVGVLALCIKCLSKGPAFYSQERIGYAGKVIRIWKLRTMYTDAESRLEKYLAKNPQAKEQWYQYFKLDNDPRILPIIGKFLRRSSLDELPQFLNVVRGDMTLVGPRPFPQYHLMHFSGAFQTLRQAVVPGLTGLWQVSDRSNGNLETQQRGDSAYIKNWSLKLDITILLRTVICVLRCKGAK